MTAAEIYDLAYALAQAADNAWEAELRSVYGHHASDARYGMAGKATPLLRALYEAKRAADDNLRDAAILRLEASRA